MAARPQSYLPPSPARKNHKLMIIKPKVRGFVCVTAHPAGCAAHVDEWISHVKSKGRVPNGPRKALVIGASTGYGLASRITAAFGSGAGTLGVFFERPSEEGRTATPGWYNSIGFTNAARAAGLYAKNINGDAFSERDQGPGAGDDQEGPGSGSKNSLKRRSLPSRGATSNRAFVLASRSATWRRNVAVGATPRMVSRPLARHQSRTSGPQ